ncbi:MAG TPA: nuclear transport factor 2 family protein [Pseudomonadales bacterium]|nr:nuclear transport factor 2 family protein [Pseudomonadales bacterium]
MHLESEVRRTPGRVLGHLLLAFLLLGSAQARADLFDDPDAVLDALHARAAAADYDGYFALYTDDAVFLGTDAGERWPIEEFRRYTQARFATGTGWTYVPTERHLMRAADGDTIWFDEIVVGASMGPCRGTGVLVRTDVGWQIAHYSLTLLVPNALADEVTASIRALDADGTTP